MSKTSVSSFPGFDGIRLLAAWAVVYSHSYLIAGGPEAFDPLSRILGEAFSFGGYAVKVFFIMSGFLLSTSLDASMDPLRFLTNRIFRIVPGFIFAIMISVLLIGPLLYKMDFMSIFASRDIWKAMFWSVSDLGDYIGIGRPGSRYPDLAGTLNGSLWSIPYEVVSYLVLLALYMLLRKGLRVALAALAIIVVTIAGSHLGLTTVHWDASGAAALRLPIAFFEGTVPYFCGGIVCHAFHKRWGIQTPMLIAAIAILFFTALTKFHDAALAILGPLVVVWLGTRRSILSHLTERVGDLSYGVYLFGWPVSLLVTSITDSIHPLVVFAWSVLPVSVLAYAMHRLIEIPVASRLKPAVLRWIPRFPVGAGTLPRRQRAARIVAYLLCLTTILRFVIYPYPSGANWYGPMWPQLAVLCLLMALILRAGHYQNRLP